MDEYQFEQLMGKLEEIRCGVIDVEENAKSTWEAKEVFDLIDNIRNRIDEKLNTKTGWGRNEIKYAVKKSIEEAMRD